MTAQTRLAVFVSMIILVCSEFTYGEKPIKLYKEESTIALKESNIAVRGLYFFENRSDFELDVSISYPFQVNAQQLFPEAVALLDPKKPLTFEKEKTGIQWTQHFEPSSIETVLVAYSQVLKEKEAIYMLKRSSWNGKVDKISIVIELPLTFKNVSLSLEPDSSRVDEHKQSFFITRRYFEAKQDLAITWE
jgi:hypothetical protein